MGRRLWLLLFTPQKASVECTGVSEATVQDWKYTFSSSGENGKEEPSSIVWSDAELISGLPYAWKAIIYFLSFSVSWLKYSFIIIES